MTNLQQQLAEQKFASQLSLVAYAGTAGKRQFAAVFSNTGPSSDAMPAWSGFERIDSPQWDLSAGPVTPPELPDLLLEYRTSLLRMQALSAEEVQQPKTRFERARSLFVTGQAEQALVELDWLKDNLPQPNATVLQFRTLALAQLGKADEAATAFAAYKLIAPSKSEED